MNRELRIYPFKNDLILFIYDGVGVGVGFEVGGAVGVGVAVGGTDGVRFGGPVMIENQNKLNCRRENLDTQPQGSLWSLLVLLGTTRHFCCKPEP